MNEKERYTKIIKKKFEKKLREKEMGRNAGTRKEKKDVPTNLLQKEREK